MGHETRFENDGVWLMVGVAKKIQPTTPPAPSHMYLHCETHTRKGQKPPHTYSQTYFPCQTLTDGFYTSAAPSEELGEFPRYLVGCVVMELHDLHFLQRSCV